ncbi:MAG TPA: flagellar FlbD family protein [bacterium]|jgi:flagellar protein FlbD|nr:flagellar FlbD family protein [bacterium]
MIQVTRLNNTKFIINADLIETIEANPDTMISLTTGKKFVVRESVEEVMRKIIAYKRTTYGTLEE